MKSEKSISVIIPTHNRSASLRRTLDALCTQTYPIRHVEVVVVADGCTDQTVAMLRDYRAPYSFRFIDQPGQGPAAARNYGASKASGQLFLFLDDDVEPTPPLIEAHMSAHQRKSGQVVIGPYPPVLKSKSFSHLDLRDWWEAVFQAMGQVGHRFSYSDLLSGNLSIEAELFFRIGEFDSDFTVHEDYELGMRLIKAGVPFVFVAEAVGYHHDKSGLKRSFLRKFQEGQADVLMAHRHPEFFAALDLTRFEVAGSFLNRIMRTLAFGWPTTGDTLAACFRCALELLEWLRLRHSWRRLYGGLLYYWYWRGVADKVGTRQVLVDLSGSSRARHGSDNLTIELDLREGLEAAEQRLDEQRPTAARVRYGQQYVGLIPSKPGAEPLRGAHLRPILADCLAFTLLEALVLNGAISTSPTIDRLRLSESIRSLSPWFGPMDPNKIWWEQYNQWNQLERRESER